MIKIRPSTQSQYLVQASPWAHYFTSFSGIRHTASTAQYADGVTQQIYQLKGPKTLAEFNLAVPFDPTIHFDVIDFWKNSGCDYLSLTVTPVTCGEDPQPLGTRTIIVPDAQMTSLNFGVVDRTSGNPSTIELTFVGDTFTFN
jgi:hypothetical protein